MPVAWVGVVRVKSLLIAGESRTAALVQFLEPETAGDGLSLESLDAIELVHLQDVAPSLDGLPGVGELNPGREYYICQPRGIGASRLTRDAKHLIQTRRR